MIYLAAPLHDVGKIGIRDELLGKPTRLSVEEFAVMKQHVQIGTQILANGCSELLKIACSIAGGHHEKWDGSGYPYGLAGTDIPLEARIVAVADVFEALCSERPYKRAWSVDAARAEILACSGTHFDPDCVSAFVSQWPRIQAMLSETVAPIEQMPSPLMDGTVLAAEGA
jgi:putative two-component system response regulator